MTGIVRGNAEQTARRRRKVVEYTLEGWGREQIGAALGIDTTTVGSDRRYMSAFLPEGRKMSKRKGTPPKYDWMAPPPPDPVPYPNSPLPRIEGLVRHLMESSAVNALAHNAERAKELGDEGWFVNAQLILKDAAERVGQLQDVLADEQARRDAMSPAARDDLNGRLRHSSGGMPPRDARLPRAFGEAFCCWWGRQSRQDALSWVRAQYMRSHGVLRDSDERYALRIVNAMYDLLGDPEGETVD